MAPAPKIFVWRQNGAKVRPEASTMASVQIKNVPDNVRRVLRERAAAEGQSLQEYLLARLIREAETPTLEEVLNRAGGRAGGALGFGFAADSQREDRRSR
jgi:plasmid stability protein